MIAPSHLTPTPVTRIDTEALLARSAAALQKSKEVRAAFEADVAQERALLAMFRRRAGRALAGVR